MAHVGSARDWGLERDGKDTMAKLCKPGMTKALVTSPTRDGPQAGKLHSPKRGGEKNPPNSSRFDLLNKDLMLAVPGIHQQHPLHHHHPNPAQPWHCTGNQIHHGMKSWSLARGV